MTPITADDRLQHIQCLALQRWARHLAHMTETHERKARAIAARAIVVIGVGEWATEDTPS